VTEDIEVHYTPALNQDIWGTDPLYARVAELEAENERLRAENERLLVIIEDAADRANRGRARVVTVTARAIEKAIRADADAAAPPDKEKP
jgi:hypothetical protein